MCHNVTIPAPHWEGGTIDVHTFPDPDGLSCLLASLTAWEWPTGDFGERPTTQGCEFCLWDSSLS